MSAQQSKTLAPLPNANGGVDRKTLQNMGDVRDLKCSGVMITGVE